MLRSDIETGRTEGYILGMCGRATRWLSFEARDWTARGNLCPAQGRLVVRVDATGQPETVPMRSATTLSRAARE